MDEAVVADAGGVVAGRQQGDLLDLRLWFGCGSVESRLGSVGFDDPQTISTSLVRRRRPAQHLAVRAEQLPQLVGRRALRDARHVDGLDAVAVIVLGRGSVGLIGWFGWLVDWLGRWLWPALKSVVIQLAGRSESRCGSRSTAPSLTFLASAHDTLIGRIPPSLRLLSSFRRAASAAAWL